MDKTKSLDVVSLTDAIGIIGSATCALHCVLTPILLVGGAILPTSFAADESFHRMLLWIVLPSSLLAFGLGCWRHKDVTVLGLGVLGLIGLALPIVAPHGLIGESAERGFTVVAAGLLITAHVRNFRQCRADCCDHAPSSV